MTSILPVTLTGEYVRLEPLSQDHHDGLVDAVNDGELWKLWYTAIPAPEAMAAEIDRRLELQTQGSMLPFATRRLGDGKLVGMTTFMNIDASLPRVEIGSTWNAAGAQGSGTNPDSKLLLLSHAFETLGCTSVEFRTSWHNHQSRAAIARLGAKQDGVLRSNSRLPNGTLRDVVVFSILPNEWPGVKAGLEFRLAKRR
ncbi:GNAT family N-acetyltransferase [Arthrobacter russicus]|uniref:RimJ/RimL family protein N-acetyltransferase n=1 Tax=Arthrobacter russicus TaxID=172040 RepID=A0ABU1JCR6_9MICC|nr:GNAT family protein [Arthrobacter russicus]MDR6270215.1 RimJ/RimL family protein N-acetyltransferase [Arthrobacter russicus]